jgi:hypothetical protein
MITDTQKILDSMIESISEMREVQAIGMSGSKSPLPAAGEGDIDIFIYCSCIPEPAAREAALKNVGGRLEGININTFQGGHWGTGDLVHINGVETWLMYFTVSEASSELDAILEGRYPDKVDNYYFPIGRCAMLRSINVLYDRNTFLCSLKKRLNEYPDSLAGILIQYHLSELEDTEDLERATARKDVMFYHFALDIALDHFLQALFALNRCYFPSRKRSLEHMENFSLKPEGCSARLLETVRLGGSSDCIARSYGLWSDLVKDLGKLCRR